MRLTKEFAEPVSYVSAFGRWDEQATVRVKPSRILTQEQAEGHAFFSPELVPLVSHPLVQERGEETVRKLLIYHLYTHLEFTENLEHEVVNQVAYEIGRGRFRYDLPKEMVGDAWKLYVDEAYHFKFSADLLHQVERVTGLSSAVVRPPAFLDRLKKLTREAPHEVQELVMVFFTIISETLISGTLSVVPNDRKVVQTVRDVIGDHAEDEKRHHAYFAQLLERLWEQLTKRQQMLIGRILPELIFGFLQPDEDAMHAWLAALNFQKHDRCQIISDTFSQSQVAENIRQAAKVTLKHLERNGVFQDPAVADAFGRRGLITR